MRLLTVTTFVLALACACKPIQDVGYLRKQIATGTGLQGAEEELIELREDGYMEADAALADLYYRSQDIDKLNQLPETADNSKLLLRLLSKTSRPEVHSEKIEHLCRSVHDDESVPLCTRLRLHIAKVEGNEEQIDKIVTELTEKYATQHTGTLSNQQSDTIYHCAQLLLRDDIGSRHLTAGLRLAELGHTSSPKLFLLSARYEYKHKYLMPTDALLEGLSTLAGEGSTDASFLLGRMYADGSRVPDTPLLAEKYLRHSKRTPKSALHLGRLYLSGKLGGNRLQEGVDHLLFAARHGIPQGYMDLAHAFNGSPGIRSNPLYVWVFANMAVNTTEDDIRRREMEIVTEQLTPKLTDRKRAQELLDREQAKYQTAVSHPRISERQLQASL